MVRCHVGTTQCDDEIFKCEKKIRIPPNITKVWSNVVLILSNVMIDIKCEEKNIDTTKCDKSIVISDVNTI